MPKLAAKIAPQRSTQYASLASALAPAELRLSPVGTLIQQMRSVRLAGQPYLVLDFAEPLSAEHERRLWEMGATTEFFWFHETIGGISGPFLQPLVPTGTELLPAELVEARRYRGKTNELFSQVLINLARWAHRGTPATLLDPLMGGGTFLFIALRLGMNAAGIEQQRTDVESTDAYLDQFLTSARVKHQRKVERVAGGRRTLYTIYPPAAAAPLRAVLAHADTADAPGLLGQLPAALRPDLIVSDLPYGIQHKGEVEALLSRGLPAWTEAAAADAVLALAWDATHTPREHVAAWVEAGGAWNVLQGGAWEQLAHPVDRVIKRRDIIVARRIGARAHR
ncbi:MAG: TRM11 family methyltransferase [Dehalococcoidia bacterium]